MAGVTSGQLLAVGLAGVAGYLLCRPSTAAQRLIHLRGTAETKARGDDKPLDREIAVRRAAAVIVAVGTAALIGGPAGIAVGVAVAVAAHRGLTRVEPAAVRRSREDVVAALPLAVDLLAACLRGGLPLCIAVEAVAKATRGPLGQQLARVAGEIRLGADQASAWRALDEDPTLAPLARAASRASLGGAPLADILVQVSKDQRRVRRISAAAAARRVGVLAAAPLGLCFLPAFVLIGVVPVVGGMASQLWTG